MSRVPLRRAPGAAAAAVAMAVAGAAAAPWPAYAHHSSAMYDAAKVMTLTGSVKSFQWTNPHCVIWLLVQSDAAGQQQEWSVETTSPGVLTRSGWTRTSVKPGERVTVELHPLRDGWQGGFLKSVTLLDTGEKLSPGFAEKPGLQ